MPAGEQGFTLMELLVSLAITGAAAGLLAAALQAGGAGWADTDRRVAGGEAVAAAQFVLRDRIGHLLSDATDAGVPAPDATGDARAFSFVGPPPAAAGAGAPLRYLVELDRAGTLVLATADARASTRPTRWRALPLLANVRALRFAYFGRPAAGGIARWWADWPGMGDPPALVRLRVAFAPDDPRVWPDLVIRPGATVSATCRLDPDTGTCAGA